MSFQGAYTDLVRKTQGVCFLGLDAVSAKRAEEALFMLIEEARVTKKYAF